MPRGCGRQVERFGFRAEPLGEVPPIEECPEQEELTPVFDVQAVAGTQEQASGKARGAAQPRAHPGQCQPFYGAQAPAPRSYEQVG